MLRKRKTRMEKMKIDEDGIEEINGCVEAIVQWHKKESLEEEERELIGI